MTNLFRTLRSRVLPVVVVGVCVLASPGAAQPDAAASPANSSVQTAGPAATTQTTPSAGASRAVDPNVVGLIELYAFLLVGFPFVLFGLDIVLVYVSLWRARKDLLDRVRPETLTKDQLKLLGGFVTTGPPGIAGLTRSIIALSFLLIIGVALFHLMVTPPPIDKLPESVDRILMLLTGALIAITGFYFGSRASMEGRMLGTRNGTDTPSSGEEGPTGSLALDPDHARPGQIVAITGGGFGTNCGTITFGSSQAGDQDIIAWTAALINVKVPANARAGHMNVIVTKDDGHQLATPPTAFTVLD